MERLIELETLIESITDPKLKHDLLSIGSATQKLWGPGTRIIRDFTDHSVIHSNRIAGYINKILKLSRTNPLSESERFLLIAGIYLHDIGMQCDIVKFPCIQREAESLDARNLGPFFAERASDYSETEAGAIRENHHLITAAWIRCARLNDDGSLGDVELSKAIKSIDPKYIDDLIDVCRFHRKLNILDCPYHFKYQQDGKARKRLVAALLRFGDELDIDSRRASLEDLKLFRIPPENRAYWILHNHTTVNINSDDGRVTLLVSLLPEDKKLYGTTIRDRFINEFRVKNQTLLDLLVQGGFQITFSPESRIIEDDYEDQMPPEVIHAMPKSTVQLSPEASNDETTGAGTICDISRQFDDENSFQRNGPANEYSLTNSACKNESGTCKSLMESIDVAFPGDLDQVYKWTRFWCPREGRISLSDGGYLYDPESEYGRIYNPDVAPFERIAEIPCLILLGEPGMGKTQAMIGAKKATEVLNAGKKDLIFWFDLSGYQCEDMLVHRLFENEDFVSWQNGDYRLHIFLDGLDECLVRTIAKLFIRELKFRKCPIERLNLRIACRTNNWTTGLENDLRQLWGKDAVGVYELAPLRRVDIVEAMRSKGIDIKGFLCEIDRVEAVPLAIKPITLEFLLNTFSNKRLSHATQTDLYREVCTLLCEEVNPRRRDMGLVSDFAAEQLLAVAARIAAVTIFAKLDRIWTGLDMGDSPEEAVSIRKLKGGFEKDDNYRFHVNADIIKDTLCTGIFSSRGPNLTGFAHQTYAEFLAAWYLVQSQMTMDKIMSLLAPEGKLIPQLYGVAAWTASMRPDIFGCIAKVNPDILLRSDLGAFDEKENATLVEILLKQYDEGTLLDFDRDIRRMYKKLNHPNLAEQLKPYIRDKTKNYIVRRVAISVAEACGLQLLQENLANMALDLSETLQMRINAAHSVCVIGDEKTKSKLRPLVLGEAGEDPDDELKGYGLQALWPNNIGAEELFSLLTPPKKKSLFGAYNYFISFLLAGNLKSSDLIIALEWVEKYPEKLDTLTSPFAHLADDILLRSWENLDHPGVLSAFIKVAVSRLDNDRFTLSYEKDSEFKETMNKNNDKRRLVLETMLASISDIDSLRWLVYHKTPLVSNGDFTWLMERLKTCESTRLESFWARLINYIFDRNNVDQIESILFACKSISSLANEFSGYIEPIKLDSSRANKLRERYLRTQEDMKERKEIKLLDPPPTERVIKCLKDFESGDYSGWWRLNMDLTLKPDSERYDNELEPDLTTLPGWKSADATIKDKIIRAARVYILEQDPETSKWIGQNVFHRPALAGYRALRLLLRETPNDVSTIPQYAWKRWASIVLSYPLSRREENIHRNLLSITYRNAPEDIIQILMLLIDKENKEFDNIFIIRDIECCWDERLAKSLFEKAKEPELKPPCMGIILSSLLDHKSKDAKEFAKTLVSLKDTLTDSARSKAIIAASVLMIHADDAGWSILWPAIQSDLEFGQTIIASVSQNHYRENIGLNLKESQLAELYLWLVSQYPYKEDPSHDGVFTPGPRDRTADFRDSILNQLKLLGNEEACEEIRRIAERLPDLDWLKWTLYEAQIITQKKTWKPLLPEKVIEFVQQMSLV